MFSIIKKLFGDSWDNDLLKEISRRKFVAYTQIASKDKIFKETPELFNQYVIDLDKAFKQFIKHVKMTYGDPIFFKDKYESKNNELLNELFIIGEKCINGYTKSKFKINTNWDDETHKSFFEPIKEEMINLLKENYLDLSEPIRLLLATGIADCFHKKIHNKFPNHVLFIENFFIDGIDPYIQEYINNTKSDCMNEVLDIYEDNLLKTKEENEKENHLKEKLRKEILEELKEENNIDFTTKFENWYKNIKDTEMHTNIILSKFIKDYSKLIHNNIKDGMIAYLFETALYKGYTCAEYFINEKKYNDNIDIQYTNDMQSTVAMIKLDELMNEGNDEIFMNANIDRFFHNIVKNDNGSYEDIIVDEQKDDIVKNSKYYMIIGILYRFTELNMRYGDFPNETDVSMITQEDFPKLYKYIRK